MKFFRRMLRKASRWLITFETGGYVHDMLISGANVDEIPALLKKCHDSDRQSDTPLIPLLKPLNETGLITHTFDWSVYDRQMVQGTAMVIDSEKPKPELIFMAKTAVNEPFTDEEQEAIMLLQVAMRERRTYEANGYTYRVSEICKTESAEGEKYEIYGVEHNE